MQTYQQTAHHPAGPQQQEAQERTAQSQPSRAGVPSGRRLLSLQHAAGNRAVSRLLHAGVLQAKLQIGQPDDQYEQEAERAAAQVMHMPEPQVMLRTSRHPESVPPIVPPIVDHALQSTGQPLEPAARAFLEPRFGHDFGHVRIHTGETAAASAQAINARAYTVGRHIVFGSAQYVPATVEGRRLLAHELTHTLQQSASGEHNSLASSKMAVGSLPSLRTKAAGHRIQRAQFRVGAETINVNFGGLSAIGNADLVAAIETRFVAYTGAVDASSIHATLTPLTAAQQRWVLYALDLLQDNTRSPLHDRLNRTLAVQRLIAHAPAAAHSLIGSALGPPEEEALRVSGWLEVALAASLSLPPAASRTRIGEILNPPLAGGAGAALDVAHFHARMVPAVKHLIDHIDPAHWPSTGTQSLSTLQTIGNELLAEARDFFSPFAHTSRTTVFGLNPPFHISANIFSVSTLVPNQALRKGYLRNRATIVGRNTTSGPAFSDTNIFSDVNFDITRAADRVEFEKLVTDLEADAVVAAAVDRLIQHTGRQSGTGAATQIGLSTEYNADVLNECQARWQSIETLCHEIMHALAHPDFTLQSQRVNFGQVLLEGVPEVLSTQMFNQRVKPKAATNAAFKARMEVGLASAPCPAPPDATIGYGAAGSGAEEIRTRPGVGDDKLRAAFFLGQVHLLGL